VGGRVKQEEEPGESHLKKVWRESYRGKTGAETAEEWIRVYKQPERQVVGRKSLQIPKDKGEGRSVDNVVRVGKGRDQGRSVWTCGSGSRGKSGERLVAANKWEKEKLALGGWCEEGEG